MSVTFEVSPGMEGSVTPYNILGTKAWTYFTTFLEGVPKPLNGILFRVVHPEFRFEAGFENDNLYLQRNEFKSSVPIVYRNEPLESIACALSWSPTELIVDAVTRPAGEPRRNTCVTPPTIPPNSLINWARKQTIIPTTLYASLAKFYEAVSMSLESINDRVKSIPMFNPFWDITYEGKSIASRKPKSEPDINPTIEGLLWEIALAKTFDIVREYPTAGGRLDFLISGSLATGERVHACVEFKHAHSDDLEHGLTKQLPAYLKSKGSDRGYYCVMYFKGDDFNEPKRFNDLNSLNLHLQGIGLSSGLRNIEIRMFDFSRSVPPSKL